MVARLPCASTEVTVTGARAVAEATDTEVDTTTLPWEFVELTRTGMRMAEEVETTTFPAESVELSSIGAIVGPAAGAPEAVALSEPEGLEAAEPKVRAPLAPFELPVPTGTGITPKNEVDTITLPSESVVLVITGMTLAAPELDIRSAGLVGVVVEGFPEASVIGTGAMVAVLTINSPALLVVDSGTIIKAPDKEGTAE